jgi:hypothetical protein
VRDQTGIVVLTAHHSIADGLSLAFAIRDLLQFMSSGNVPERLPALPAMEELIAKAHLAAFTCVNRRMPNARLPYQSWDPRDTSNRVAFQTAAIPPAVLSGWRAACRKAKTTMNAALCTALVRASREISPQLADRTCSLVSPVSRREALGVGDQCGLFLGWGAGEFR